MAAEDMNRTTGTRKRLPFTNTEQVAGRSALPGDRASESATPVTANETDLQQDIQHTDTREQPQNSHSSVTETGNGLSQARGTIMHSHKPSLVNRERRELHTGSLSPPVRLVTTAAEGHTNSMP